MHSYWTGDLAFGQVIIPIKICSATAAEPGTNFVTLHRACETKIVQVKRCPKCKIDLTEADVGKGVEVSKDKHVLLTEKQLAEMTDAESADGKKKVMEILRIAPPTLDLPRLEKTSWVMPGSLDRKSYALMRDVLKTAKRCAVVRVTLRSHPKLGILSPSGGAMTLTMLRTATELVSPDPAELPNGPAAYSKVELALATKLALALAGEITDVEEADKKRLKKILDSSVYGKNVSLEGALEASLTKEPS